MSGRLKEFITLLRLQTGATTAIAPVTGYILANIVINGSVDNIKPLDIVLLFVIGLFIHIFLFVYNEYRDVEIDRLSPDLKEKPLVKGIISPKDALLVSETALVITAVMVFIFYFNFLTVVLLVLLTIFNALYDIIGKKIPGADVFIAVGIFLAVLFGASVVTQDFPRLVVITGLLAFMQIMFNNSVEGGLKDVDHDHLGDARTIATVTGLVVTGKRIKITSMFRTYAFTLKIIHISILLLLLNTPILRASLNASPYAVLIFSLLVFLVLIIFSTMYRFLNMNTFDREKMKQLFSVHEISTYYLVPVALSPLLGLSITLLLLLVPLIWYIGLNIILYGQPLQPRV